MSLSVSVTARICKPSVARFADDHKLYALDAVTGTLKWSYATGGPIVSSPAIANGVVYIGSTDDNVYAFHLPGMS